MWAVALQVISAGMNIKMEAVKRTIEPALKSAGLGLGEHQGCSSAFNSQSGHADRKSRFSPVNPFEALLGPLADSGADGSFVGARHADLCFGHDAAQPQSVDAGNGLVTVDTVATLNGAAGLMQRKYLLPDSWESLVSVGEV
jgi:hypothetical protein